MRAPPGPTLLLGATLLGAGTRCGTSGHGPQFERFDPRRTPGAADLPDAPAVVLFDRGTLRLAFDPKTDRPTARLRRYRRVKILRESGLKYTHIEVPHDHLSAVRGLRVRSVRADGTVAEASPPAGHIADPDGGGMWRVRIPHVSVGTVIETVYDLERRDPRFIPPWRFAGRLPTRRSEYAVVAPVGFALDFRFTEDGAVQERPPQRFETDEGVRFSWSRSNLDPIYPEERMPDPTRIAPVAHVIFKSATRRGQVFPGFPSWEAVGTWFLARHPDYERISESTRRETQRTVADVPTIEKALKLTDLLARTIAAEHPRPAPLWRARAPHPDQVLVERRGNPTSRGLLLVALLRSVGIAAMPALFTYRNRGLLDPDAPAVTLVDGVAAVFSEQGRSVVLDPSQLTVSADVPSPRLMGTRLIVLREGTADVRRVPVSSPDQSRTEIRYDVQLDPHGALHGPLEATLTGAEAGALRARLFSTKPPRYADAASAFLKLRGAPIPLERVSVSNLESLRQPLRLEGNVRGPVDLALQTTHATIRVGTFVGANARIPREVRRTTLILGAPCTHLVRGTLTLPEAWRHTDRPPSIDVSWSGGVVELTVRAETPRRVGFIRRAVLRAPEVPRPGYRRYRRFVQEVAVIEDEVVTVRRPSPP